MKVVVSVSLCPRPLAPALAEFNIIMFSRIQHTVVIKESTTRHPVPFHDNRRMNPNERKLELCSKQENNGRNFLHNNCNVTVFFT